MNNAFFTNITIENFKSLRKVELTDCRRINVLIGKPNVGKSNLLEALSFFSLAHHMGSERINPALESYIRYENSGELFFNGNRQQPIKIQTNLVDCSIHFEKLNGLIIDFNGNTYKSFIKCQLNKKNGSILKYSLPVYGASFKTVKRYIFERDNAKNRPKQALNPQLLSFLNPPYGSNLMEMMDENPLLTEYFRTLFQTYGLDLIFDKSSFSVKIMKQIKNNHDAILKTIILPYSSMADTLQRIIFYKTAIASNQDSILLLEEPEAHSFPPYIAHLTQEMVHSVSNQFFITTHSPFVLDDLMQNARQDLAVFILNWKNGETIAQKLTDEQLEDVYQYGVDLFTNIEAFF